MRVAGPKNAYETITGRPEQAERLGRYAGAYTPLARLQEVPYVCLSNVLRRVSWQKTDDLRVRREKTEAAAGEAITRFLDEAARSAGTVAAFLAERGRSGVGRYSVREADARRAADVLPELAGGADAVITSPLMRPHSPASTPIVRASSTSACCRGGLIGPAIR